MKQGALDNKGGMFFVELKSVQPDGSKWTTEAQDKLASKWSAVSYSMIVCFVGSAMTFSHVIAYVAHSQCLPDR